jgi:hypothetical protein
MEYQAHYKIEFFCLFYGIHKYLGLQNSYSIIFGPTYENSFLQHIIQFIL